MIKFVTGGFFSKIVPEYLCADNFKPVDEPDVNGMYTVTPYNSQVTYGATLTLNDNINVNYKLNHIESDEEAAKYTVYYTFDGVEYSHTLSSADSIGGNSYKFKLAEVYSYQMGETFDITVKYNGATVIEMTYSVSTYFHNMINKYGDDPNQAKFIELCYAGLDFGAAAQLYFDGKSWTGGTYHTDSGNLINADTNPTNTVNVEKPGAEYESVRTGSITGITKYGKALIFGSETSVKIFLTGDVSGVTVTCQDNKGHTWTPTEIVPDGNRYSFMIRGIKSFQLNRMYTFTITKGAETVTLTYSPYTYARNMWDNSEIGPLVKAMVAYGNKANAYWPNPTE
jgi:hypothetical protein